MRMIAGLAILLVVGLLLNASMVVYAAYVLVLAFWLSKFLARQWLDNLKATRTMSNTQAEIGQKVSIQINLQNRGKWPIPWLLVEDPLPNAALHRPPAALRREGQNIRICWIPGRSSRVISYSITAQRRGYFQVGPLIAESGDLFGLHRRFRALTEPARLLVVPKVYPLDGYSIASRRPVGEINVSYRTMEDPTLMCGIRQYQNGDPLRSIHWRATARTGQLQSKQYQPTCVAGATLVLDFHRKSNPRKHDPVRGDLACTAAASIGHTLMLWQQQFGLISNGRDAEDRIVARRTFQDFSDRQEAQAAVAMANSSDRLRPIVLPVARGPEHFAEMLKILARLERTDGLQLPDLLIESQTRMPRDATVLVIVQEVDEPAALAMGLLRRQGYSVSAIVNNYENEAFHSAVGRLMAQRVHVYHLFDEQSIPTICREMILRY